MAEYGNYTDEYVRDFMVAAHKDLGVVQATLGEHPALLNIRYKRENGERTITRRRWEQRLTSVTGRLPSTLSNRARR